jgi:glycosyltransferase involved in cell wall biosynthesis
LKRLYAPILYNQILRHIKDAPFAIYVTQTYLQSIYPVRGKMFGCTDTFIPVSSEKYLEKRFVHIDNEKKAYKIGLIGFYHGQRKGVDTAIRALSLTSLDTQLHVLGLGSSKDRSKWMSFAHKFNYSNKLNFPNPFSKIDDVLKWIDTMDLIILPSRSEGLPRAIIESMSRACPIITSNVAGLPELISNQWLHNPGDYKKLNFLIEKALNDKSLLKAMAKENYEKSKSYSFEELKTRRNVFLKEFKDYCVLNKYN